MDKHTLLKEKRLLSIVKRNRLQNKIPNAFSPRLSSVVFTEAGPVLSLRSNLRSTGFCIRINFFQHDLINELTRTGSEMSIVITFLWSEYTVDSEDT